MLGMTQQCCDVLWSDGLVKKLEEMEKTAGNYRNLMDHTRRLLRAFFDLSQAHRGTDTTHLATSRLSLSLTLYSWMIACLHHHRPITQPAFNHNMAATNLEYSGISLNMENSGNHRGILCNIGENF